jgi:hypothetical protein
MNWCAKRSPWLLVVTLACVCMVPGAARGDNACNAPGDFPDVIVGDLFETRRWGSSAGITAFSVGTISCNVGTCQLDWIQNSNRHPVIGQSMYRLKDGRFEQIGQSWLKHGFFALSEDLCYPSPECQSGNQCCQSTNGSALGVHCSDPYTADLNGQQSNLGPKWEVNASTGAYPWPPTAIGQTGNSIFKRLQVRNTDLDPALNPGAQYVVEGQYVTSDDAAAFRHHNNASYRRVNVSSGGGTYNITLTGPTVRTEPAINFWATTDPTVYIKRIGAPGDGLFSVASKATDLGNGTWHYEYAVHNLNSHRSGGSFSIPLPHGANVTNIGFHDVDYHSGEVWEGKDWVGVVEDNKITWATDPEEENAFANAIRWATTYNFRFDADFPPVTSAATIGLWRAGSPSALTVSTLGPQVCDNDGVCDPGEDCTRCAADCNNQGGLGGCCGDTVCNPGESPCSCMRDCGSPQVEEFACSDGEDDDCDGQTDCDDSQCCSAGNCSGPDGDDDGYELCDCNDADGNAWSRPGEVENVTHSRAGDDTILEWDAPIDLGATTASYEVVRSSNALNFLTSTSCLGDGDPSDTELLESEIPAPGEAFSYLVRAVNGCPGEEGEGDVGRDSENVMRPSADCP